jgi:hypothetical protein
MPDGEHRHSVKQIAALFRKEQPTRPVLLLGAGASYRSGVPLADKMVQDIARYGFAVHELGSEHLVSRVAPSDWKPFLESQRWFLKPPASLAENFPLAVEHFLKPQEVRRRFLSQAIRPQQPISQGYHDLAELMSRRLCWTVLTTNFDSLLAEALQPRLAHLRDIREINRVVGDLAGFSVYNRCQAVYLHGAVEYYRDCNLEKETQTLDDKLVARLWPLLAESPLVVVGYRGYEKSVTEHLLLNAAARCEQFRHGIYWCVRSGSTPHPNVAKIQSALGANFTLLEIDGFDELMRDLRAELHGETVFSEHPADERERLSWDARPASGAKLSDVDLDLAWAKLVDYAKRLELGPIESGRLEQMMLELRLAARVDGNVVPTNGAILLFGRDPQRLVPHALVSFVTKRKKQTAITGNLISQLTTLAALLQDAEVNPVIRLKNETGAVDVTAYPRRALTELTANLLVHRDYEIPEHAQVSHTPGDELSFSNPGGVPERLKAKLKVLPDGTFDPIRGESDFRNPVLADIFYGLGFVDKRGSGLPDVRDLMPQHGGTSAFSCGVGNRSVITRLLQAEQKTPRSGVAVRRSETDIFITNLLPFSKLPANLFVMPLHDKSLKKLWFESDEERAAVPLVLAVDGQMISLGDFRNTPELAKRNGVLDQTASIPLAKVMEDEVLRRYFVRLVGTHWSLFLNQFEADGLVNDYKRKRAYFKLLSGQANTISYSSRLGRSVSRDVVKMRGEKGEEHENEGVYYAIVNMGGDWAVQLKPMYVFTDRSGLTPLPPRYQTSRATRRFKFDRNKSVDDDLTFWSRYFGRVGGAANLGRGWDDDLLLEFAFASVELPVSKEDPKS